MAGYAFTFFGTAIGRCGVAWSERGVASVMLPEAREIDTWRRMLQRFPGGRETTRPPHDVHEAIDGMVGLLAGEAVDLGDIELDLGGVPAFERRVYAVTRSIPRGETLTYGEVARRLGASGAPRAVGQALGKNPVPIIVPCHRVLAADGATGGFSAPGGVATKFRILTIEGALAPSRAPTLFDVLLSVPPTRTPR